MEHGEDELIRLTERIRYYTESFSEISTLVTSLSTQVMLLDQRLKTAESEVTLFREAKHSINKFLHVHEHQVESIMKSLDGLSGKSEDTRKNVESQVFALTKSVNELQNLKYALLGGCAVVGCVGGVLTTILSKYISG